MLTKAPITPICKSADNRVIITNSIAPSVFSDVYILHNGMELMHRAGKSLHHEFVGFFNVLVIVLDLHIVKLLFICLLFSMFMLSLHYKINTEYNCFFFFEN
jgi:TRAP-type uncharacterized transport system fused permease subunit